VVGEPGDPLTERLLAGGSRVLPVALPVGVHVDADDDR
jgi:hypothetical protein